jgi:hypothetical protein
MYSIRPKALNLFNELENFPWFENIGKDLDLESEMQAKSIQCESLEKALESMLSVNWANFKLEKKNVITEYLSLNNQERLNMWNKVVEAIQPAIYQIIATNTERFEVFGDKTVELMKRVKLDLVYLCTTAEYEDVVDIEFFIFLTYWYSIGKLPCGWVGDPVNGKILVY